MKNYKKILPLFSIILLAVLLYFSDLPNVLGVLSGARLVLIPTAVLLLLVSILFRVMKWKLFLNNLEINSTWRDCFYSYMPALFLSNFTPARIGEPVRSYFLKKIKGVSISKTMPSIIMERALDMLGLVVLSIFILFTFNLGYAVYADVFLIIFIIVAGIFLLRNEGFSRKVFNTVFRIFSFHSKFKSAESRKEEVGRKFHAGFKIKKRVLSLVFVLAILVWMCEGLIFYVSFLSLGIELHPILIISIFAFSVLMGVITFLPGGIGSMEFVFALILSNYIPLPQATAGIILGRFLTFWLIMFIASVFWRKV